MSQPENSSEQARIDTAVQAKLGRRPRAAYRGYTRAPVPLEHIELLLALRRAEREHRR